MGVRTIPGPSETLGEGPRDPEGVSQRLWADVCDAPCPWASCSPEGVSRITVVLGSGGHLSSTGFCPLLLPLPRPLGVPFSCPSRRSRRPSTPCVPGPPFSMLCPHDSEMAFSLVAKITNLVFSSVQAIFLLCTEFFILGMMVFDF